MMVIFRFPASNHRSHRVGKPTPGGAGMSGPSTCLTCKTLTCGDLFLKHHHVSDSVKSCCQLELGRRVQINARLESRGGVGEGQGGSYCAEMGCRRWSRLWLDCWLLRWSHLAFVTNLANALLLGNTVHFTGWLPPSVWERFWRMLRTLDLATAKENTFPDICCFQDKREDCLKLADSRHRDGMPGGEIQAAHFDRTLICPSPPLLAFLSFLLTEISLMRF